MKYEWRPGSRVKANAQAVGQQFEMLAASADGLTPQTVLDANRAKGTPLHDSFEWNNKEAAEKYRLSQAGHFIRCIAIRPDATEEDPKPQTVRAFFNVTAETYEPLAAIIAEPEKKDALLRQALDELSAFRKKYEMLKALQPVFDAVVSVMAEV